MLVSILDPFAEEHVPMADKADHPVPQPLYNMVRKNLLRTLCNVLVVTSTVPFRTVGMPANKYILLFKTHLSKRCQVWQN